MILVDTSIWLAHLRQADTELQDHLLNRRVLIHPFVAGEIACGNLRSRSSILSDLRKLPFAVQADDLEVLTLIEQHQPLPKRDRLG